MIRLTEEKAVPVETIPNPDFYVRDQDYVLLSKNIEARKALLKLLGLSVVVVDRLGQELIAESLFEKKELAIDAPDVFERKELGYHHRI